ncbi:hypothetical protein [Micromonospora sp. NBC_00858]|uniref:hypothetical protein n=1 Tax=Micromonospora sp. NBC_00858 TaxID=2975979 RepID=UPI003868289B|nr:hypothetical protein OG990_04145 [Micromonospora sp. NBC_00858]
MKGRWRVSYDVDARPFWRQRGWQLSAAFFAVILLATVVVSLRGGAPAPARPVTLAGPLSEGAPFEGDRPVGCHTDDSRQDAPVGPPDDVTWRELNGAPVPLSASAGPRRTDGPLMWCFARTPAGAVMAAHVIPRQLSGNDWRTIVDQQVVSGAGRDLFVAMRSSIADSSVRYTTSSVGGFSLLFYSAEAATVRLLIRVGSAGYAATEYRVAWSGGDWKMEPSTAGDLYSPLTPVADTAGFILWGK